MVGYAAIGLHNAKCHHNVGHVLRAAGCFGAAMVATSGGRYKRASTDTNKTWKSIPLVQVDDLRSRSRRTATRRARSTCSAPKTRRSATRCCRGAVTWSSSPVARA